MVQESAGLRENISQVNLRPLIAAYLQLSEPLFTVVSLLLAERQVDQCPLFFLYSRERDHVLVHLTEIVPSIRVLTCSQTLQDSEPVVVLGCATYLTL